MKIAVLGTGVVGRTLARRFAELGHTAAIGTRDPAATSAKEEYAAWAAEHPEVGLATFADAAVGAAPSSSTRPTARPARRARPEQGTSTARSCSTSPTGLDFSGGFPPLITFPQDDSMAEQLQRAFPAAMVVKSLNTMTAAVMAHPDQLSDPAPSSCPATTLAPRRRSPACSASSGTPTSWTSVT